MRRLLIRPGGVGDFIVSLPALEHLKGDYTEVWTAAQNVPLARFANRAQSITSAGLDRVGVANAYDVISRLQQFDSIVSWYGTNRPDFRAEVAQLPFQFHEAVPPANGAVHAVDFFAAQVGLSPGAIPRLQYDSESGNYAAIHPFSGNPRKNWPIQNFRELARRISRYMLVRWCCGPEEQLDECLRFKSLDELGGWLAGARLYVGNDSGISHLAAATGIPVIAIFRNTDPLVWAPRGRNVRIAWLG